MPGDGVRRAKSVANAEGGGGGNDTPQPFTTPEGEQIQVRRLPDGSYEEVL